MSETGRDRILSRIREANEGRSTVQHPGPLPSAVEPPVAFGAAGGPHPIEAFTNRFTAAGGEVVHLGAGAEARTFLDEFCREFSGIAIGERVPEDLRPDVPEVSPERAALGVSMALGAAAQTGSLLLTSAEGRRHQLLPPVELVWVRANTIHGTLGDALAAIGDLPAAVGLHSGPSKSADIGQILVRGVHGPGRIVAAVLG